MLTALLLGALGSSALLVGGALGSVWAAPKQISGILLASLADTLMPEAFEHGRPLNSFATSAGFLLAFVPR